MSKRGSMSQQSQSRFRNLSGTTASGRSLQEVALRAVECGRVSLEDGRKIVAAQALEFSVQSAICDYLDAQRIPYARTDAAESFNRNGQRVKRVDEGWPDLTGCYAGFCLAIECKRAVGGNLSYEQAAMLESLYRQGALVVVARSVDEVIDLLHTKKTSQATIDEIVAALKKGPKLKRRTR